MRLTFYFAMNENINANHSNKHQYRYDKICFIFYLTACF